MTRFIVFLRAVNVGGGRTIKMDSLRHVFESFGFSEVETFMASGNVVFETTAKNTKTLERQIEKSLQAALGYEVAVFIGTEAELAEIAAYKPFRQSKIAAAECNIIFLADTLDKASEQKVVELKKDTNEFHVHGREIYGLRRKNPSSNTFSTVPLAKTLDRIIYDSWG